jgi:hypothetical protein
VAIRDNRYETVRAGRIPLSGIFEGAWIINSIWWKAKNVTLVFFYLRCDAMYKAM